ncbi:MAG: hypothetical protein GY827_04495 [Cytophagales bacterium]|nr:hypothetical protein [Cytophagales bacterium]
MYNDLKPFEQASFLVEQFGTVTKARIAVKHILDTLYTDEIYTPGKPSFDRVDDYWTAVDEFLVTLSLTMD